MGAKKKYLIKSINFGDEKEPARILIEKYIKKYLPKGYVDKAVTTGKDKGKFKRRDAEVSNLIRKMVVNYFSHLKEFQDWKKDALIFERKELNKQQKELYKKREDNKKELEQFGVEAGDIDAESFRD